jgi:hypothetical protein
MAAANTLPVEKRETFLQRIAGPLRGGVGTPSDSAVSKALERALAGLVHAPAAEGIRVLEDAPAARAPRFRIKQVPTGTSVDIGDLLTGSSGRGV